MAPEPESDNAERKKMMNLLTAHLTVLATFKRPRYVTREPELTAIIMHLLSHRAPHVKEIGARLPVRLRLLVPDVLQGEPKQTPGRQDVP